MPDEQFIENKNTHKKEERYREKNNEIKTQREFFIISGEM